MRDWHKIDDLPAWQDKLLGETLELADRSPFYRRRWGARPPTGRADLAGLPMTTKQDLRDGYPFDLLAVAPERLATYHESSGTGGIPTASFYTDRDWDDLCERFGRKPVPIGPSDLLLVRTPYALMMTGHLAHEAGRRRGVTIVPADNRSLATPYSRVERLLHDLGITLTWSLPTEPLVWAAAAEVAGHPPAQAFPALRAMFIAGEPVSPARRARIAQTWGVPVIEEYGSTETGPLAGQCPQGTLHLWADRAIVEVYDPCTGQPSSTGTGQLVVTPLGREAMPLVRYNIEDVVEIGAADCPCGWRLPTVRVLGRAHEQRVGGTEVRQVQLEQAVFTLPERYGVRFWRARVTRRRLLVQLEVSPSMRLAACGELACALSRLVDAEVEVIGVDPGTVVPFELLTAKQEVMKPRTLFGPDEDWDRALRYY
jgi:phenylacetate-CoA ligase